MAMLAREGGRIYFEEGGDTAGEVLLMSNSLASNMSMWALQVDALGDAGFRVVRYDNRGHGASDALPGPYSIGAMVDDAIALLDELDVERAHFCGLSLGGIIGQMLAARAGTRLKSLTLCATAAHLGPPSLWNERVAAVRAGGMQAVAQGTIERWFTEAARERIPERIARVKASILGTSVTGYCESCAAIRDMDLREAIAGIDTPTHVIVGESDPATPVAASEFIHSRIADSKLTVIPAAAHMVNVEQDVAFITAVLEFLTAVR